MKSLTQHVVSAAFLAMLGLSFSPIALSQGSRPGTIIGATSMIDDAPGKSKAAMELERAMSKAPAAPTVQPSLDRVKLAIQTAQDLMKARKYPESLATLAELDGIANKTDADNYLIERTRIAVASFSNDKTLLIHSLEMAVDLPATPANERVEFCEMLALTYFNQKDFPKTIVWSIRYFKEGGSDMAMRRALVLAYYLSNDFARATQEVSADIQMEEQTGGKPSEEQLRLLVSCAQKLDDKVAYASALEKYAAYYARKN